MNIKFSIPQIADIATKVRTYKTLHVTTNGQMFHKREDAEEAVRTLNLIISDTNDHVGILEVTEDMVASDKLKTFGKSPKLFEMLFEKAKIPVSRGAEKKPHTRIKGELNKDSATDVSDVKDALGLAQPKTGSAPTDNKNSK